MGWERCDYCGAVRPPEELRRSSETGKAICIHCQRALAFLDGTPPHLGRPKDPDLLHPRELLEVLDRRVVGQRRAKEVLAAAVAAHLARLRHPELELRPNVLLLGPSGTGKTLMVETLARYLDLPVAFGDATALTQAGYVGEDVEMLLTRLLLEAQGDVALAETGIVFLDEVDKLARKEGARPATFRDVSGEGVQHALLKLIEGGQVAVPLKLHKGEERVLMRTHRVLWILAGAFEGLEEVVRERRRTGPTLGFGARREEAPERAHLEANHEDLIAYGFAPEFVGRIGFLAPLVPLTPAELVEVLRRPGGLLAQYQALFRVFGAELHVPEKTLWRVVEKAKSLNTGARGLQAVLAPHLARLLAQAEPGKRLTLQVEALEAPPHLDEEERQAVG
jgi:ATP-dependent Clp protease ATP-binding subunit ClpX